MRLGCAGRIRKTSSYLCVSSSVVILLTTESVLARLGVSSGEFSSLSALTRGRRAIAVSTLLFQSLSPECSEFLIRNAAIVGGTRLVNASR